MKKYILSALVIILSSLSLSLYAQSMDFSVAHFSQYDKNTGEVTKVLYNLKGRISIKENTMLSSQVGYEPSLWLDIFDKNNTQIYSLWFARSYNSKWDVLDAGRGIFLKNPSQAYTLCFFNETRGSSVWYLFITEFDKSRLPKLGWELGVTEIAIVEEDFDLQLLSIINEASIRKIVSADDLVDPSTLRLFECYLSEAEYLYY
ncbi:MAG: hypothetical protein II323_05620 [Tidjanibacter sp.]|nr:hypothetical protein [Tidjanibacter sp.]